MRSGPRIWLAICASFGAFEYSRLLTRCHRFLLLIFLNLVSPTGSMIRTAADAMFWAETERRGGSGLAVVGRARSLDADNYQYLLLGCATVRGNRLAALRV